MIELKPRDRNLPDGRVDPGTPTYGVTFGIGRLLQLSAGELVGSCTHGSTQSLLWDIYT